MIRYDCQHRRPNNARCNYYDLAVEHLSEFDVRADLVLGCEQKKHIWGQIKDSNGSPVPEAVVTLYRRENGRYEEIERTNCNCQGFYEFNINSVTPDSDYEIVAMASNNCNQRRGCCECCGCELI